ncbi:MAG: hypothetical protein V4574_14720, partial [Pseudomonadota bacterium]
RLRLATRAVAYPHLAPVSRVAQPALPGFSILPVESGGRPPSPSRMLVFIGLLLAGLAALIAVVVYSSRAKRAAAPILNTMHAPIVEIAFRERETDGRHPQISNILSEALTRSWATQVRDRPVDVNDIARRSSYRIALSNTNNRITMQLIDTHTGMVMWTDAVTTKSSEDLHEAIAPSIAKLVGPFGVIARNQAAQLKPSTTGSYACLLRYFAFYRTRDLGARDGISTCLAQPVDEPQLAATVNAVRAFYTMEAGVWNDREAQLRAAERFVLQATEADADDPYARYAKARLAYVRGRCDVGLHYGDLAVDSNPYDVVIVTVLSGLTAACSPEKGAQFLDRAYRIRNDNDIATRASLTLSTIVQGQERRLGELGFMNRPAPGPQLPNYLLTESLIAAAQGRRDDARALWTELRTLRPLAKSDDERLKPVILSDRLRGQVLDMMRTRGVIAAGE